MFFKPKHSHREDAKSAKEDKEDKEFGLVFCFFAYLATDKHSHRKDAKFAKEEKKDKESNLHSASSRSLRLCGRNSLLF